MTDVASTSFIAPTYTDASSFAEAVASGAYDSTQLAWAESVFESRGLGDLAHLLQRVREGRVGAADVAKVRRAIERLAFQRETKVRKALASAPWQAYPPRSRFAPFDPAMVAAALFPRVTESAAFVTAGGATGNVTPRKPIQHASSATPTPPAVGMLDIYTTVFLREVVAALYSAQLITAARPGLIQDESIQEVRVDHFFPSEVTDRLDRIFYELDGLNWDTLETGPDVERALNEVGIEGLVWKHTSNMGSFVILHRTPIVPGAQKPGVLVLAVLPKGHQAPTHVHRSGTTNLPGEITLGVEGTLRYRDYTRPDDPDAEIQTAPIGQVRISPAGSKDVYSRQEDLWAGIYWQPEPSQNVE